MTRPRRCRIAHWRRVPLNDPALWAVWRAGWEARGSPYGLHITRAVLGAAADGRPLGACGWLLHAGYGVVETVCFAPEGRTFPNVVGAVRVVLAHLAAAGVQEVVIPAEAGARFEPVLYRIGFRPAETIKEETWWIRPVQRVQVAGVAS